MPEMFLTSGSRIGGDIEMIRRFLVQGGKLINEEPRIASPQVKGRKAQVLAVVHGWMPELAAGSERMMLHMLAALPKEEFDVHVMSLGVARDSHEPTEYVYEGMPVTIGFHTPVEPDLIITHHGYASRLCQSISAEFPKAAVVAVFHNERYDIPDILGLNAELNVYNTAWVKKALDTPGIVVHPPLEYNRHYVPATGDLVTLINLQKNKGVDTFHSLVRSLPETGFLGVVGTHGEQERGEFDNLEIMEPIQDMRLVWSRSRVVLMPSGYESFGMVAAEACASGIPVIAHPTPGLVECLGSAGIFIDREDTQSYQTEVKRLFEDQDYYEERSAIAANRGLELVSQTARELTRFVNRIRKLVAA